MDKLRRPRKIAFVALATLAVVLAVSAPSQALGMGGHGFVGGHPGEGAIHQGFDGRHFEGHRSEEHHFDRDGHGRFGFGPGPVFPYYGYYPYYGYGQAPASWYYCPSYGAYYPNVTSCPEAWETVPAS